MNYGKSDFKIDLSHNHQIVFYKVCAYLIPILGGFFVHRLVELFWDRQHKVESRDKFYDRETGVELSYFSSQGHYLMFYYSTLLVHSVYVLTIQHWAKDIAHFVLGNY